MPEPLFFAEPPVPPPPAELSECGPEWRAGYVVGWNTGPAIPPPYGWWPRIGNFSPLSGKRKRAAREGLDAGREAKRSLVEAHLVRIYGDGQPLTALWNNYPRDGWVYEDAFFFPYATSRLPACVPMDAITPCVSEEAP